MHIDIMYRPTSKWTQEELKKLQGKWFVKKLSGELKGCATFYDNKELAQMEACYLADHGICPSVTQVYWKNGRYNI